MKQGGAELVQSETQHPRRSTLPEASSLQPGELNSRELLRYAEDTPQTAAEVEAVLRSVEIITRDSHQPTRRHQQVQMACWADAALRADLEREGINSQHGRILSPRLELP